MIPADKCILVVDSAESSKDWLRVLSAAGFNCHQAATQSEATLAITAVKPDLILLNVFCRTVEPLEFLAKLRETPGTEGIKIITLSAQPGVDLILGEKPAVAGYLTKPVEYAQLLLQIQKLAGPSFPTEKISVLVADGDAKSLDITRRFLETAYYRVVPASSGQEMLPAMAAERPAAVVMDLLFGDMNGFELIREIRKNYPGLPLIITSSLKLNQFQERGYLTSGPEFVANGITSDFLLKTVTRYLGDEIKTAAPGGKPKVVLADDEPILLELMKEILEKSGFSVAAAADGQEALDAVHATPPDVIVLDYDMPSKNGFMIAQELKADHAYAHIPIIIITANSDRQFKLRGLSLDIDDYLTKPVDTDELVARIRMIIKRTKQVLDTNPLTRLPGNPSIQARVEKEIIGGGEFAVLYFDLNQFKAFNDAYGFDAGDKVIKATASILINQTKQCPGKGFIGHIGGDDFIIVASLDCAEELAKRIIKDFDAIAPSFYSDEDRQRGYIMSTDRKGAVQKFPLLSIAVGIVHNQQRKLTSFGQVSEIGSELKHHAKSQGKSFCAVDRRTDVGPAAKS